MPAVYKGKLRKRKRGGCENVNRMLCFLVEEAPRQVEIGFLEKDIILWRASLTIIRLVKGMMASNTLI